MNKKKSKSTALTVLKADVQQTDMTPMSLIHMAVDKNLDIDKLKQLVDMQKDWREQKAREAFFAALSGFQRDCPEIRKTRKVDYTSKNSQSKVKYNFASLGDIERQIKEAMQKHDLTKRWEITEVGVEIIVTCLVTHKDGHTERTAMRGKKDDSGSKNEIQQVGSTIAYLERYSLLAALGISTADTDNDGQSAGGESSGLDHPIIPDDKYKSAMAKIIKGELTVAEVLNHFTIPKDKLAALETAEKSRSQKP
jgi:hypothetical protein